MKIIQQISGGGCSYPPIQEGNFDNVPEGCALWPDELPTEAFYAHNGFAHLDIRDVDGVLPVVSGEHAVAEWEAWKAGQPEEPEGPEEPQSDVDRMAAAYRAGVMEA